MPKLEKAQQDAVKVVLRFFRALNKRDWETVQELIHDEHVDHTYMGHGPVKPEAIVRMLRGMVDTFPDWFETVDEVHPGPDGTVIVRQTGRGTQEKTYMGAEPTGRQVADTLITTLKIEDGKIKEYRSTFPFRDPREEQINAAEDLQEARAEQGGLRIADGEWETALQEYAEGRIDDVALQARKPELVERRTRCQALLAENMRRCQNEALPDSIYCSIHQQPGVAGGWGA